jgi:hypothetical protein
MAVVELTVAEAVVVTALTVKTAVAVSYSGLPVTVTV